MNRIASLTLAVVAPWWSVSAAPVPYDRAFPQDTGIYFEVSDFARTQERWNASPLGKAWKTDEFKGIREGLDNLMKFDDEEVVEGMEILGKLSSHFTGRMSAGLGGMDPFMEGLAESIEIGEEKTKLLFGSAAENMEDFDFEDDDDAPKAEKDADEGMSAEDQAKLKELEAREAECLAKAMAGFMIVAEIKTSSDALIKDLREMMEKQNGKPDTETKSTLVESKEGGLTVYTVKTERVDGEKDEDDNAPDPFMVFSGNTMLVGINKATLVKAAESLSKGGGANSLVANADYAATRARLVDADVALYLDLPSIGRFLGKKLAAMKMDANPIGLDPANAAKVLELDALAPLSLGMKIEEKGMHSLVSLGFTRETKLSKVLMPLLREGADRPAFVPKEVGSAASVRINLPAWYDAIMELGNGISPAFGMGVNMGLMQVEEGMGIKVKADLIDLLGDSVIYTDTLPSVEALAEEENPMAQINKIIALRVKNVDALRNTINTISQKAGNGEDLIEKNDYLGVAVYTIANAAGEPPPFGWAFLGDYLVMGIGNPDAIKSAVRAHKDPAASLWTQPSCKAALATVPAGAPIVEFSQVKSMIEGLNKMLGAMKEQMGDEEAGDDMEARVKAFVMNLDLAPFAKVLGDGISHGRVEGSLLISESMQFYGEE